MRGDVPAVEQLLSNPGVDVNSAETGDTALGTAAAYNRLELVQLLLRRGADPNVAGSENLTALESAAYHGYAEVVKLLLGAGAGVNAAEGRYGYTPLASAAFNGHIDVIRLLLDAGADREVRINDGRTALQLAQHRGHLDAAKVLMFYREGTGVR